MFKIMITAASSNSGKTAVTCGLLSLLKRKGYSPCAFKCGPDYIDPMFHRSVMGIQSNNLDYFLAGEETLKSVFASFCKGHGAAVCEGVMGYYDGRTGSSCEASAWHVASLLDIPALLVLRPKGSALTLAAIIKGMAQFRQPSRICGVIFNDCSEMFYNTYAPAIEAESGIPVLGYLPHMEEAVFESRHLGLMTAAEIGDLSERIERIGSRMEETLGLERLFELFGTPEPASEAAGETSSGQNEPSESFTPSGDILIDQLHHIIKKTVEPQVRIAVARDEAFNFIYAETLTALEEAGADIVFFSPLHDAALPADIGGLYLPGGYPELHVKALSENESMRASIKAAIEGGLPTIAECGGFLYLGEKLEGAPADDSASGKSPAADHVQTGSEAACKEGQPSYDMVGVLPGSAANANHLVRFGYGCIESPQDNLLFRKGEQIPVHEFHYWETTANGSDLTLTKASNGKQWQFGYATDSLYAGFPHLYPARDGGLLASRFVGAAKAFAEGDAE